MKNLFAVAVLALLLLVQLSAFAQPMPPGLGGGEGGTNGGLGVSNYVMPDYGTNLWIAQVGLASGTLTAIASNTLAGVAYELQTRSSLNSTDQWLSTGIFITGSQTTNWTALNPVAVSLTNNMFIRLLSWAEDGSGLPLWWQLQYFGTTGIDPNALDAAGDGWTIYQKFEMGLNPDVFSTPPAPQGVTVTYNAGTDTATISWLPSPGAVIGYTVERIDDGATNFTVSGTNFEDDLSGVAALAAYYPDWEGEVSYSVQADYAHGDSALNNPAPLASTLSASILPGPQGAAVLAVSALPPGAVALRVAGLDEYADINGDTSYDVAYDISVTTNGMYWLPNPMLPPTPYDYAVDYYYYQWYVKAVDAGGNDVSAVTDVSNGFIDFQDAPQNSWLVPPYFDGRAQLKQNLIFLLRAATVEEPFHFDAVTPSGASAIINPPDYAYAGFYTFPSLDPYAPALFDPTLPFQNNYTYRNFAFDPAKLDGNGRDTNGVYGDYTRNFLYYGDDGFFGNDSLNLLEAGSYFGLTYMTGTALYQFSFPTVNDAGIPAVLATNDTQWLCSYPLDSPEGYYYGSTFVSAGYLEEIGVTPSLDSGFNNHETMAADARNLFGLPFLSAQIGYGTGGGAGATTTLFAGDSLENVDGYFYPETAQPQLQLSEYDFWNANLDALPGATNFLTSQTNSVLIAPVGAPGFQVVGYAKLSVQNGYSGIYGYLGQYFDQAYQIDTNGVVTTNTTGVLSSYGNFFPTQPGPVALVTMPDLDTGAQGTAIVYCVSLQLDANHDGAMDTSFNGADVTSQSSPMEGWVNDGYIVPGTDGNLDQDAPVPLDNPNNANDAKGQITCPRDLENFFRLWICGMPALPANQGYTATLSCSAISGSPAINLYAAEDDGGTLYLTDTNTAQNLAGETKLGTISPTNTYTFPDDFFDGTDKYFMFEGAGIGEGQFTLTIYQNGNAIAQTSAYIDLHDVEDLYEQANVTNVIQTWPEMVQQSETSGFQITHYMPQSTTNELAVFVHGWRMTEFDYEDFSDLMFKRLYWQGYQGGFASLYWPTRSADTDTNVILGYAPSSYFTYNRSEHIAFESGTGAAAYFNDLRQRFPDDTISACSHSMGGIVMMEALKELAMADQVPLDNYVMMQAAVPAECYDTTVTNFPLFEQEEEIVPTPNTYSNFAAGITNALQGKIINFYNSLDYALGIWQDNEAFIIPSSDGLLTIKPNTFFGYSYNSVNEIAQVTTNSWQLGVGVTNVETRIVTDPLELMPFVARPRSLAVGAQGGVGQAVNGGQLDLTTLGFGSEEYDHSGEFNRNIQTPQVQEFYTNLVIKMFPSF